MILIVLSVRQRFVGASLSTCAYTSNSCMCEFVSIIFFMYAYQTIGNYFGTPNKTLPTFLNPTFDVVMCNNGQTARLAQRKWATMRKHTQNGGGDVICNDFVSLLKHLLHTSCLSRLRYLGRVNCGSYLLVKVKGRKDQLVTSSKACQRLAYSSLFTVLSLFLFPTKVFNGIVRSS